MKTIITAEGNTLQAKFDLRFGRASWFCLLDELNGKTDFIENDFNESQSGAGTRVAQKIADFGAEKVISGDFGPKAKDLLDALNIQMVILQDDTLTVDDIIQKLK